MFTTLGRSTCQLDALVRLFEDVIHLVGSVQA